MIPSAAAIHRFPPVRILLSIAVLILMAGWIMLRMYTSNASRECSARYHAARTAADSAGIDSLVPDQGRPEAHSCGFIRGSARWR